MNLTVKQVSSLEKIGLSDIKNIKAIERKTVMKGESFSYQITVETQGNTEVRAMVESYFSESTKLYAVKDAVCDRVIFDKIDDDYMVAEPCLVPDILMPFELEENYVTFDKQTGSIWVTVKIPEDVEAGEYVHTIKLSLKTEVQKNMHEKTASDIEVTEEIMTLVFDVIDETLPEQKTIFTQWFHTDCIADVHNVLVYSEEHWDLIDKYMALASELGVNMILTPVITPPLDTGIGVMRPCTQLVKMEKSGDKYSFDFSLLGRWILLAKKNGLKYFEISHLFSQWGLEYTPNIMVKENGKEEYKFGWHVKAQDEEYKNFLNQFVPALVDFFEQEGVKDRCWFHISDEPSEAQLEAYKYAYDMIKPLIGDCHSFDAISDYDFYAKGLIPNPVPSTDHIEPFLENKVKNLWTYYCCGQGTKVGNRFLAMPSHRNRILGLQMYKYDIVGFLHWGYNFYRSKYSLKKVNPYLTTSSDKGFPSGDAFSVYPVTDGVIPSLRAVVFKEALSDIEICRTLEKYIGKDKVIEMIDKAAGMNLTFSEYPRNSEFIPELIEKMEKAIKEHTGR